MCLDKVKQFFTRGKGRVVVRQDNPEDSTKELQDAIDKAKRVIVQNRGQTIYTGPIHGRSNQTIVFEEGLVWWAHPDLFDNPHSCLFRAEGVSNLKMIGKHVTVGMDQDAYKAKDNSEHRHGFKFLSCQVEVEGFSVGRPGGDCFYFGASEGGEPCLNMAVKDVESWHALRNGLTLAHVDGAFIEDCAFNHSNGSNPMAGVCLEPNKGQHVIKAVICNVTCRDNRFAQFMAYTLNGPVQAVLKDCTAIGGSVGYQLWGPRGDSPEGSSLYYSGCTTAGHSHSGAMIVSKQFDKGEAWWADCQLAGGKAAVHVSTKDSHAKYITRAGGVVFDGDCTFSDPKLLTEGLRQVVGVEGIG